MEFLKKYSGLITFIGAILSAVAILLTCFISQEWYFIVGIIIFSILTIGCVYLYGWNNGNKRQADIENLKNKPFPDSLFQYFAECEEKREYEEIIRFGSAVARPLWLSQQYEARLKIGEYIYKAAKSTTPEKYERKVKSKIDYIGWTAVELNLPKAEDEIKKGIYFAENSTDAEFNEKHKIYYIAKGYRHLFGLYFRNGNIEQSRTYLEIAINNTRELSDSFRKKEAEAEICYSESLLLTETENYNEALVKIEDAKEKYERLNVKEWLLKIANQKAEILIKKGDKNSLIEAEEIISNTLKEARLQKFRKQIVRGLIAEGHFYYKKHRHKDAIKSFNDGLTEAKFMGMKYEIEIIERELENINNL